MRRTRLVAVLCALALAGCGGGGGTTDEREAVADCLRDRVVNVQRSEDFIAEEADGGGLEVGFENDDTATLYFARTEAEAVTIADSTRSFAEATYHGAEVEQHGNVVIAYWQEAADESKDTVEACL